MANRRLFHAAFAQEAEHCAASRSATFDP